MMTDYLPNIQSVDVEQPSLISSIQQEVLKSVNSCPYHLFIHPYTRAQPLDISNLEDHTVEVDNYMCQSSAEV